MTIAYALGAVWLGALFVAMLAAALAPEGYEDEVGFHYGRPNNGKH